jgi:hypothetical protein
MALTIKSAESLIIDQWRTWSQECDSYKITDMMKFHFSWLPKNRPDLLVFKSKADKWCVVHRWLQGYEDIHAPLRNPLLVPQHPHNPCTLNGTASTEAVP